MAACDYYFNVEMCLLRIFVLDDAISGKILVTCNELLSTFKLYQNKYKFISIHISIVVLANGRFIGLSHDFQA